MLFRKLLTEPDRFIESARPQDIYKNDDTTTVARASSEDSELVIKRYNTKNIWHVVRRAARRTRAAKCWDTAHTLLRIGVQTPAPVAFIEERVGPFRGRSFYISEHVCGEPCLSYLSGSISQADADRLVDELAQLFHQFACHRFTHGDMKATNIMVCDGRPVLIDLDAARLHRSDWTFKPAFARDQRRFMRNWHQIPALHTAFQRALRPGQV